MSSKCLVFTVLLVIYRLGKVDEFEPSIEDVPHCPFLQLQLLVEASHLLTLQIQVMQCMMRDLLPRESQPWSKVLSQFLHLVLACIRNLAYQWPLPMYILFLSNYYPYIFIVIVVISSLSICSKPSVTESVKTIDFRLRMESTV